MTKNNFCNCLLQSVENRCGWSEKRNEDAQEELRQALKEKEKMIEVTRD